MDSVRYEFVSILATSKTRSIIRDVSHDSKQSKQIKSEYDDTTNKRDTQYEMFQTGRGSDEYGPSVNQLYPDLREMPFKSQDNLDRRLTNTPVESRRKSTSESHQSARLQNQLVFLSQIHPQQNYLLQTIHILHMCQIYHQILKMPTRSKI